MPATASFTPLPVVERELRVAARKRHTFWTRVAAALVALVVAAGFLILSAVGFGGGGGSGTLGRPLFSVLTWLSLAAALSAGLFLTSDCLSEEKREGTLGLLFLTSLRGHDVVFGKLLATSLRGFFGLLAVLPVLAVTLLMGGVTGTQFLQTSLALVNALLASLVAGLFVSVLSRDSQKAMVGTLVLMAVWAGWGPAVESALGLFKVRTVQPWLSLSSPVYLFLVPGSWGGTPFWPGLWINLSLTGVLLGLTSLLVRHTWQERPRARATALRGWTDWWRYGGMRRREGLRRRLLDRNPVLWLACRERWQAVSLWGLAFLLTALFAVAFATGDEGFWWIAWNTLGGLVTLVLYLGIASQAARQLLDARRSGLLDLVLSTPLTARQIVQGEWRALLRLFGLPLLLCVLMNGLGTMMVQQRMWKQVASANTAAGAGPAAPAAGTLTNTTTSTNGGVIVTTAQTTSVTVGGPGTAATGLAGFRPPGLPVAVLIAGAGCLSIAANLAALAWFGMWMGFTSRSTNLATLKTVVLVQVLPWFGITIASMMAVPLLGLPGLLAGTSGAPGQVLFWFPIITTAVATVLALAKDAAFILYAHSRLTRGLRRRGG